MIEITVTAEPGDTVYNTAYDTVHVAMILNRTVDMVFNDTRVRVYPNSNAQSVVRTWEDKRRHETPA